MAIIGSLANYGLASRRVTAMTFSPRSAPACGSICRCRWRWTAPRRVRGIPPLHPAQIQSWLVKGYPLTEAIRRGYPSVRRGSWRCSRPASGWTSFPPRWPPSKRSEVEHHGATAPATGPSLYPSWSGDCLLLVLFITTFVMPQFKTVLEEMVDGGGDALPAATRILLGVTHVLVHDAAGGWLWGCTSVVADRASSLARRRRPERPYLHSCSSMRCAGICRSYAGSRRIGHVQVVKCCAVAARRLPGQRGDSQHAAIGCESALSHAARLLAAAGRARRGDR